MTHTTHTTNTAADTNTPAADTPAAPDTAAASSRPDRLASLDVLISGASIAGPALALWLAHHGARVTVVEKAPALRDGGSAVDFRGAVHRTVLRRMGIWDEVHRRQTRMGRQVIVDADDRERVALPAHMLSGDVEIFRGRLTRILHERTRDRVTYVFGDSIATLEQDADGVDVTFEQAPPRRFDLVVGADGLHSRTRSLAFGPEERCLRFLGHYVAGFELPNHLGLDRTSRMYCEPGRMVGIANHGQPDAAAASFFFASGRLDHDRHDLDAQKEIIAERYRDMGWHAPLVLKALAELEEPDALYFDAIAQIRVDRLSKGRVVLLGDAGYGATMGGIGSGTALVSAYVLAGELAKAAGDHRTAFAAYEAEIGDHARKCQRISGNAGPFLAPATERRIRSRDRTYRLLGSRVFGAFFRRLTEQAASGITLPDYPQDLSARPDSRS
ncbi:FAD-dependent monooxygenase [Streptomyces sp. TS71-3]|uniref:FAD-dependent monooxygenase n=1 Tax=Streptomyces sp. TS71-3 TaxID=2733862 RepID=UPI001B264599|nr:FAD-dependent monooxygenase [Streptomyces sp. TS71-3]GHJ36266.1 FAD-dependent oxidoreductase [Streptomyces sp. TS71-3]